MILGNEKQGSEKNKKFKGRFGSKNPTRVASVPNTPIKSMPALLVIVTLPSVHYLYSDLKL
jgi:hypothetical protein